LTILNNINHQIFKKDNLQYKYSCIIIDVAITIIEKMKQSSRISLLLLFIFFIASCSIEKRLYRSGYHVQKHNRNHVAFSHDVNKKIDSNENRLNSTDSVDQNQIIIQDDFSSSNTNDSLKEEKTELLASKSEKTTYSIPKIKKPFSSEYETVKKQHKSFFQQKPEDKTDQKNYKVNLGAIAFTIAMLSTIIPFFAIPAFILSIKSIKRKDKHLWMAYVAFYTSLTIFIIFTIYIIFLILLLYMFSHTMV